MLKAQEVSQTELRDLELRVRITTVTDQTQDLTIFPLASHKAQAPIDTLAGFLNKRRGAFYLARSAGQEVLLPLRHSLVFELTRDSEVQFQSQHPGMARSPLADPGAVVSYAPVAVTLVTGRVVRGDLWFYDFEEPEERNVAAGINREFRYVCLHGEKSTYFVRREAILKVLLQGTSSGDAIHPEHVTTKSGLVDVSRFRSGEHSPTALDVASRMENDLTPPPLPLVEPTRQETKHRDADLQPFPFAPRREQTRPGNDQARAESSDEIFWY